MKTDEQLVSAYLNGELGAFDELVRRHLPALYGFAFRIIGNAHDAEDASQEAIVKAWKHLRTFDVTQSFRGWIFRITRNAAYDLLKKKRPVSFVDIESEESDLSFAESIVDPSPLPDEIFDRTDLAKSVSMLLAGLPESQRLVLLLRYNDHLTFREIGEALEAPLDTVKSRHQRALVQLKKLLLDQKMAEIAPKVPTPS